MVYLDHYGFRLIRLKRNNNWIYIHILVYKDIIETKNPLF